MVGRDGSQVKEYFRETEAKGLAATRNAQREAYGWWQLTESTTAPGSRRDWQRRRQEISGKLIAEPERSFR